jgi:ribosomal-protein-alanine N-acetyltransferase
MAHAIRPARPADAGALALIDARVNFNPWTEAQFASVCRGDVGVRERALVVEEDGRVDGFVVLSQVLDEAAIHSIAVDPAQQRRGLAQALLEAVFVQVQQAGAQRCLLEVRRSNTAARRLYQVNDFALDGVRKNYYPTEGGREDALLMSKEF